jgi:hypothetical protein
MGEFEFNVVSIGIIKALHTENTATSTGEIFSENMGMGDKKFYPHTPSSDCQLQPVRTVEPSR